MNWREKEMKNHNYADIFPMMTSKEYNELKRDIKENGQMDDIITYEGKILDGRNRFKATSELGIKPNLSEYEGDNPLQFVMSTNLRRRHLTDSQKAVVGRRYVKYYSVFAKGRQGTRTDIKEPVPESEKGQARDKAGEVVGVSGRYIDMADEVIEKRPEMEEKIMSGEIKLKQVHRDIKLDEQKSKIEKLKEVTGEYDVIVIDPPWNYGGKYDPDFRRVTSPYPEMNQDQLKKIILPCKDNSVLFLWTTHKFIWDAKELMDLWGFEYKMTMVWDKQKMGVGEWLRKQCEFCLMGIRGKPYWKSTSDRDIISESRTTHSTKPEEFYKLVERITAGRKLDYFARKQREGWDVYGNDVIN